MGALLQTFSLFRAVLLPPSSSVEPPEGVNKQPRRAGREGEHQKGVPTASVLSFLFNIERHTFAYESIIPTTVC